MDHSSKCYFWIVEINSPQIIYPDIPLSIAPVLCSPELLVPNPPKRDQPFSGESSKSDSEEDIGDTNYSFADAVKERGPHFPNQKDASNLIRDLGLTKSNSELLISRLTQWKLFNKNIQFVDKRKCHQKFSYFFSWGDGL